MTTALELADLDRALAVAAPQLDNTAQQVAIATYRALATGQPVPPHEIAARAGVEPATVEALLNAWGAVFRDPTGCIVGFWGLAIGEMPHRLLVGDSSAYAWCAWDPLFLALLIGPLTVATHDPETGDEITYRVDADGAVHDLSHPDSVISFLRPEREWDDDIMATFCHHVLHFAGPESAAKWTARHDGTIVLALDDAVDLARRHVIRTFGEAP